MATYDPNQHMISFGAIVLDSGFGPDTFITVNRESPAWEDEAGVNGNVQRSKINDDRGTVEITMQQTSKKNDQLTAHYQLDRATPGGIGAKPFLLLDLNGTTKIFTEEAWLSESPPVERARVAGVSVWKIRLAKIVELHGGNND